MSVKKALDQVSKKYIPGAFDFFSRMTPDPWMEAHERLESELQKHGQFSKEAGLACKTFVGTCEGLLEMYSRLSPKPTAVSIQDAFFLSEKLAATESVVSKTCVDCGSEHGLRIKKKNGIAGLFCKACVK